MKQQTQRVLGKVCWYVGIVLCMLFPVIVQTKRVIALNERVTQLQRKADALTKKSEEWKVVAIAFEKLNRECLQAAFGGKR